MHGRLVDDQLKDVRPTGVPCKQALGVLGDEPGSKMGGRAFGAATDAEANQAPSARLTPAADQIERLCAVKGKTHGRRKADPPAQGSPRGCSSATRSESSPAEAVRFSFHDASAIAARRHGSACVQSHRTSTLHSNKSDTGTMLMFRRNGTSSEDTIERRLGGRE
jgi:hypothetical protein